MAFVSSFVGGSQTVRAAHATSTRAVVERRVGGKRGGRCRMAMTTEVEGGSYTYYEGNSWGLNIDGTNVLVDPLVSDLVFFNRVVFNQHKNIFSNDDDPRKVLPIPDLIVISQSLPDHLHLPTLKRFSRDTRILATEKGAGMLRKEGFQNVKVLNPGDSTTELNGRFFVRATAGPILGPPWQTPENGYIIKLVEKNVSIYYEPHSVFQEGAIDGQKTDVVVAAYDLSIFKPINYTLVSGAKGAVESVRRLRPAKVFLINNKSLNSTGLLGNFIDASGDPKEFEKTMRMNGIETEVVAPEPGEPQSLVRASANVAS
eukprot:Plantae.Rhodophyta-Purpureofilum_apyrenoidigerum.ctg8540.p1 GENE.Plantae.Rhodophyta-Purpureofilum_apyrenoidigerum.ctg8540~~Plantae.Rhodophyta-Purpureofilum_apyrenoidigerum.ctg8540.p1  ORF type:complete len:330 (+),score=56.39 Plantae.Rhodophyta-Purpureofilum_apyrenoidigerum.ctg8540:47-991(+)